LSVIQFESIPPTTNRPKPVQIKTRDSTAKVPINSGAAYNKFEGLEKESENVGDLEIAEKPKNVPIIITKNPDTKENSRTYEDNSNLGRDIVNLSKSNPRTTKAIPNIANVTVTA
tara:strand:+ start:1588 stop:1932 length:345 start_codon:yes stop_codon:yes gene_type:complete